MARGKRARFGVKFEILHEGRRIEGVSEDESFARFCKRVSKELGIEEEQLAIVSYRAAQEPEWNPATHMLDGSPAIGLYV